MGRPLAALDDELLPDVAEPRDRAGGAFFALPPRVHLAHQDPDDWLLPFWGASLNASFETSSLVPDHACHIKDNVVQSLHEIAWRR